MADPKEVVEQAQLHRIEDFILDAYTQRRTYLGDYFERIAKLDAFTEGIWSVQMPDNKVVIDSPKIEDRVLSKLEDTGYLAGQIVPSIMVKPLNDEDFNPAKKRERVYRWYWHLSDINLQLPRIYMDMLGPGISAISVWPNWSKERKERFPLFKRIDPRHLLPPLDYVLNGEVSPHDVITTKMVKTRFLANKYPDQIAKLQAMAERASGASPSRGKKKPVMIDTSQVLYIEYWGADAIVCLAALDGYPDLYVVLDNEYNQAEMCPVSLAVRPSAKLGIHGKVEAMLPSLAAENRLMTYVLDYADQAVYAPLTKKGDVVNASDFGPNAMIDLGQNGEVGRVAPAQINPEVFKIIQDLERHSRMSGTHPMSRSGNVDQSQASATFVEALSSGLTTEVSVLQKVVEVQLRKGNEIAAAVDIAYCDTAKEIWYGTEKYTPSTLMKKGGSQVIYGVVAGLDEMNAEIRVSQRVRDGFASRRWGRENLPGIENVSQEEQRIQEEAFIAAYMQGMQAKAAQGDMSAASAWLEAIKKHGGNMIDALWEVIQANPAVMAPAPGQPGPASPGMSAGRGWRDAGWRRRCTSVRAGGTRPGATVVAAAGATALFERTTATTYRAVRRWRRASIGDMLLSCRKEVIPCLKFKQPIA